ncbi:MAG: biotin--[acetyl-CoA-carboxylase] ligase [Oscillospiraceae bacterium]|jgi:BirA family biotin operon repressor/biotin-[acetyl-CoA-carboxylase] ligase|nr:biotin--[acetyl-CoA-carboxylase] ligase [Oscillospiraceae bacterium]
MGEKISYLLKDLPVRAAVYDTVDSTGNVLKRLASDGEPEGLVIVAEQQTSGRGQYGRSFFSPKGSGVYFSLLLRPKMDISEAVSITAMAAIAVSEAIESVAKVQAGIKWVNDVICRGKKVAGILTEATLTSGGMVEYIHLGIGLNIYHCDFPDDIVLKAGSIFERGAVGDARAELAAASIRAFYGLYSRLPDKGFMDEYRERSVLMGRQILLTDESGTRYVVAEEISDDAALIVREFSGETRTLISGRCKIELL